MSDGNSQPSVLFIGDTSIGTNWGSHATTKSLRELITATGSKINTTLYNEELSKRNFNGFEHQLTSFAKFTGSSILNGFKHRSIHDLGRPFINARDVVPLQFSDFDHYSNKLKEGSIYVRVKQAIESSDVLIINGEGLLYRNTRYARIILLFAYAAEEYFDVPSYVVNHTLGFEDEKLLSMISNVYPKLSGVVFREPISAEKYIKRYNGGNITIGADAAFNYNSSVSSNELKQQIEREAIDILPYGEDMFDPTKSYVCVSDSSAYTYNNEYEVEAYIEMCKKIQQGIGQVVLIESGKGSGKLLRPVSSQLGLPLITLNTPVRYTYAILKNATGYVGGRYHPTIFSFVGGTPVVPISANTHKIQGVLKHMNLNIDIYDAWTLDKNIGHIVGDLSHRVKSKEEYGKKLKKRASDVAKLSRKNTEFLEQYNV